MRYEDVQLLKRDFGKHDPYRTGGAAQRYTIVLVPLYLVWEPVTSRGDLLLFLLACMGSCPAKCRAFQEAENSTNMELG